MNLGSGLHTSQPEVHRLELGSVTLPDTHPRAVEGSCPIFSFAVDGPDGIAVVDTGPREGHPVIDELYTPSVISIVDALNTAGLDERRVIAVVNSHLHFDHCGQNHLLPDAPVWVSAAEVAAAEEPLYTVPEWAVIHDDRRRLSVDGEFVMDGVCLLHTPGHTPGHQSVVVTGEHRVEVIAAQVCWTCAEFDDGRIASGDLDSDDWASAAAESLERLRSFDAAVVHVSHDRHPLLRN